MIISTEKIPIKIWTEEIEEGALEQAKHLANLPFAFRHIAIMSDVHQGFGMPIGGVLATKDVIIPNAVGVDIGCGCCAIKTSLREINTETLKKIMGEIRKEIPVGFNHHKEKQNIYLMPIYEYEGLAKISDSEAYPIINQEYNSALKQIGTLGGGNHFIEIQKGSDGHIWIMIHSGSRNFGLKIANYYNKLAVGLNEKWHSMVPKEWELAFLPVYGEGGQAYLREMNYAVEFALANRKLMMNRVCNIFNLETNCQFDKMINIAHNYASLENHFGQNVWVHRKGATLATENTIGIIPGSQGSKSYIVRGKGNRDSFMSCSHGAGRKMGRNVACKTLNLEEEIKKLDDMGVIHGIRSVRDLDEASGAYKDIENVMSNQLDLVEILMELSPLAVIKG
ncbi:MAG: RtcB family protein [Candidatus Omnitrophica bacterium]|nr:RtcB family protein [Candidatus Omnitrophota bacterium]